MRYVIWVSGDEFIVMQCRSVHDSWTAQTWVCSYKEWVNVPKKFGPCWSPRINLLLFCSVDTYAKKHSCEQTQSKLIVVRGKTASTVLMRYSSEKNAFHPNVELNNTPIDFYTEIRKKYQTIAASVSSRVCCSRPNITFNKRVNKACLIPKIPQTAFLVQLADFSRTFDLIFSHNQQWSWLSCHYVTYVWNFNHVMIIW